MSVEAWVHRWWAGEAGATGRAADVVLAPAEAAFRAGVRLRNGAFDRGWMRSERVGIPVISVGNVAVGGAGKTPVSAWIARRLAEWGRRPAIALRGYGEDEIQVHRELNPGIPVFRGARRVDAAREAQAAGRDVVVLDDAFQHRALARDLDIVLIAAESWDAHPRVLPRGPWREGVNALARADLLVITRKSASAARAAEVEAELGGLLPRMPVARIALRPSELRPLHGGAAMEMSALAGKKVLAVAALATPGPFVEHLRAAGAQVDAALYADHHEFTADEAHTIRQRSGAGWMVMTHKDAVKLRALLPAGAPAFVLHQRVETEAGADLLDVALRRALEERTS
ncbi:tetraacyldisaccharide 4'-kinase [Longimicrobium terrae]|uniref:Tetraacyldisaccharide 4'-kinase n=1 Tax=Longimicrobium terrae TaxID=1639882 RepID=A0A841H4Q4_9BACT|nr:tetraacyldisaccharide 4'-kinase [Longimicrobium terrae]NNC31491.1 tetraacyldisaccharide 4'-kinase [Longimicrobium terrae]